MNRPEQRRSENTSLDDALVMEEHGAQALQRRRLVPTEHCQLFMLILISNRLKEVTERLMEVEKLLKERDHA